MITALLAGVVLWSLFAETLPPVPLAAISAATVFVSFLLGRHHSHGPTAMDSLARSSRLCGENASFKAAASGLLLILSTASPTPLPPLFLFFFLSGITVVMGNIPVRKYFALFWLPAAFLLLSALTLLWDFYRVLPENEVLSLPFFGGWLAVTPASQSLGGLVLSRALGAVSCLYFLSLSTPLPELFAVLRRIHTPEVVLDLCMLIYRYLFILLATAHDMRDSAASRLGYASLLKSLRTTGLVYGRLLANSFRRAGQCFDAMESRCYTGKIAFLTQRKPLTGKVICLLSIPLVGMTFGMFLT